MERNKRNKFYIQIVIAALVIFGAQFLTAKLLNDNIAKMRDLIGHAFIFSITLLGYIVYAKLKSKYIEYSGYIFGGISLLKMMLAVFFLFPFIKRNMPDELFFVGQFMLIYIIYLFIEVRSQIKDLNITQ